MSPATYDTSRTLALLVLLAAAAICDIRSGRIFNWLTYPAAAAGLALGWWAGGWPALSDAALGLAIGFAPLFVAFLATGTGGGDAKLMAAVGSLALPDLTLHVLIYGLICGAAMAVITMIWTGRTRQTLGRVVGALGVAILGRKPADPTPADSPRVRLGVAICIGGCWAVLESAVGRPVWDWAWRQ